MSNKNLGMILLSSVLTLGVAPSAFSQTSPEKSTKPATTQKQDTGSKSDKMQKGVAASQDEFRKAQQALKDKGMYDGAVDGTMNAQFAKALSDYQTQNKLQATGKLDSATMTKLGVSKSAKSSSKTEADKTGADKTGKKGTATKKGQKQGAVQSDENVRLVQTALLGKGINPGPVDGIMGPQTKRAIATFQRQENLFANGKLNDKTKSELGVMKEDTGTGNEREKPAAEPSPVPKTLPESKTPDPDDHSNDIGAVQHNETSMGLGTASSVDDVRQVQMALKNRGYDPGEINGMISSDTQEAVRKFQAANNLPVTGILDDRTQAALGVTVKGTSNPDSFHSVPPDESFNSTSQQDLLALSAQASRKPAGDLDAERMKPSDNTIITDDSQKSPNADRTMDSTTMQPAYGSSSKDHSHKSDKTAKADSGKMDKDLHERAVKAADVLTTSMAASDKKIPDALMQRAEAVAVIPNMKKGGFGIGGSYGKGLVSRRMDNGRWSAPEYITIGGGSFGAQLGVTSTDLVLVFTDKGALDMIENGKSLKLGADANVTAGPVGREGEAGVTADLKSGVYAYSRSKGLFAGIALDGTVIDQDQDANHKVYGSGIDAKSITTNASLTSNVNVRPFIDALDRVASKKVSEK